MRNLLDIVTSFEITVRVTSLNYLITLWGNLHGVVANMVDCDIIVSKFEFQSHYYIYFFPAVGWIVPLSYFWKDDVGIK